MFFGVSPKPRIVPPVIAKLVLALTLALLLMASPRVHSHGSVVDEGDACVIQFGFYSAHFAIFQPQTRGRRGFCEDIPDAGESIFVMEFRHDSMREVPLDVRILRNNTQLGRFVRWADLEAMGDLSADTVFHQTLAPQADGVARVIHNFESTGDYIGVVTLPHPEQDILYHAVFPFSVGRSPWRFWPWSVPVVALTAFMIRRRRNNRQGQTPQPSGVASGNHHD